MILEDKVINKLREKFGGMSYGRIIITLDETSRHVDIITENRERVYIGELKTTGSIPQK